jgi:hypothetical protein
MNKATIAKLIDQLGGIKAQQAHLATQAEVLVTQLKKVGGGESIYWRAQMVKIPKHTVEVKAHKQLRLYPKEAM